MEMRLNAQSLREATGVRSVQLLGSSQSCLPYHEQWGAGVGPRLWHSATGSQGLAGPCSSSHPGRKTKTTKALQKGLSIAAPSDATELEHLALDWGNETSPQPWLQGQRSLVRPLPRWKAPLTLLGKKVQIWWMSSAWNIGKNETNGGRDRSNSPQKKYLNHILLPSLACRCHGSPKLSCMQRHLPSASGWQMAKSYLQENLEFELSGS